MIVDIFKKTVRFLKIDFSIKNKNKKIIIIFVSSSVRRILSMVLSPIRQGLIVLIVQVIQSFNVLKQIELSLNCPKNPTR
jgi:hypothetical protein